MMLKMGERKIDLEFSMLMNDNKINIVIRTGPTIRLIR